MRNNFPKYIIEKTPFSIKAFIFAAIFLLVTIYVLAQCEKMYSERKQQSAQAAIEKLPNLIMRNYCCEVYQLSSLEHYGR